MRKVILIIISLYFSTTLLNAQDTGSNKGEAEENIVDMPDWIGDSEREIIRKIEAQDTIAWSDYIQLAVAYSKINADGSKIGRLIEQSLKTNVFESCRMLRRILQSEEEWDIIKKHRRVVTEKIKKYECNN